MLVQEKKNDVVAVIYIKSKSNFKIVVNNKS